MPARSVLIAGLIVALLSWAGRAYGQVETGRVESSAWRIRISAPEGWRISAQGSYPRVIAWMNRTGPAGTMLLTAERPKSPASSVQYAQQTVAQLRAMGYTIETEPQLHAATQALWIEFDDGKTFFRQAVLISGDIAYGLTLSAPDRRIRAQHLRAFDFALRSMERIEDAAVDASGDAPSAVDDAACATPPAS
jgi:hypothetical protein